MLKKEYPWKTEKEYYELQSKDLFGHVNEVPFYHAGFIGQSGDEFANYLINESGVNEQSKVVDFGCGTGFFVNKLNQICYAEGISNSEECIKASQLNFPTNTFKLENMETYTGRNMTHCFCLETLFYSDIENTFKNANKVLVDGGVLFIKEWFDICDNEKKVANREQFENFFKYYPQTMDRVKEVASRNGFEVVEVKDISQMINPEFFLRSIKYHLPEILKFVDIYGEESGGRPYVNSYQLKFKKITTKN